MRKILIGISLAAAMAAGIARAADVAAEPIPPEQVQLYAPFAIELIQQQFPNPPVKIDFNTEKALGYHVQQKVGVIAMPDKKLCAKVIDEAADAEVPVGVFATKSLVIEDKDAPIAKERIAIADFNGAIKLPLFFLTVKANGPDRTLQVYSKDGKPLCSAPVKKQAGDASMPLALKLTNIDLEKKKLDVTVSLGGAYESTLKLAYIEL